MSLFFTNKHRIFHSNKAARKIIVLDYEEKYRNKILCDPRYSNGWFFIIICFYKHKTNSFGVIARTFNYNTSSYEDVVLSYVENYCIYTTKTEGLLCLCKSKDAVDNLFALNYILQNNEKT